MPTSSFLGSLSDIDFRYERDIWAYVEKCPFHLFDTRRNRNINRSELKDDISAALQSWFKFPLSCSAVRDAIAPRNVFPSIFGFQSLFSLDERKGIFPFVVAAWLKSSVIDGAHFKSTLADELREYCRCYNFVDRWYATPMIEAAYECIERTRTQPRIPSRQEVQEQIELFGQYAILSHCWEEDELSFVDIENITDPKVQAKKGFQKLEAFSQHVKSLYGCRYLWMDTVCIDEANRDRSIPRMFDWYRHAFVCVIYLTRDPFADEDPWLTRGWTLQEFLAARRIKLLRAVGYRGGTVSGPKFDSHIGLLRHDGYYEPGLRSAIYLFENMCSRQTKIPEDKVYCLLAALNVDIPIKYGEGFDRAFYRLQAHYLTQTHDRGCLLWDSGQSSPFNSMLPGSFWAYGFSPPYNLDTSRDSYVIPSYLPDSSISFDEDGVMHIMVTLLPRDTECGRRPSHEPNAVLAILHCDYKKLSQTYCVWLRPTLSTATTKNLPGEEGWLQGDKRIVYERISLESIVLSPYIYKSYKPQWVYIR